MQRYHITLGASTTAGGTVISASTFGTIDGKTIAVEGDQIACPACKRTGVIVCDGPRLSEEWNGKQAALESDLCRCGCSPLPRLIANQSLRYQVVDGNAAALRAFAAATASSAQPAAIDTAALFNERYRLVDEQSNQPLAYAEYAVVRASGAIEYGRTDDEGHTHLLSSTVEAEGVDIYV